MAQVTMGGNESGGGEGESKKGCGLCRPKDDKPLTDDQRKCRDILFFLIFVGAKLRPFSNLLPKVICLHSATRDGPARARAMYACFYSS